MPTETDRRSFMQSLCGSFAVGAADMNAFASPRGQGTRAAAMISMPRKIAGIPIVDSSIAKAALEFAHQAYPAYLLNHSMRTYLFGSVKRTSSAP